MPAKSENMRVVVTDDERLARKRITALLAKIPDVRVIAECSSGFETIDAVREHRPDLLFLDVQMPAMDGFETLKQLGSELPAGIIFATAYDQHAVRAFEFHALDYLLKPFTGDRFNKAFARARESLRRLGDANAYQEKLLGLVQEISARSARSPRLMLKAGGKIQFRDPAELDWVEAEGNYVRLHFGAEKYLQRETLGAWEARLDSRRFARAHRSIIVNIEQVRELRPVFHGDFVVVLKDGTKFSLGRPFRERFLQQLSDA